MKDWDDALHTQIPKEEQIPTGISIGTEFTRQSSTDLKLHDTMTNVTITFFLISLSVAPCNNMCDAMLP